MVTGLYFRDVFWTGQYPAINFFLEGIPNGTDGRAETHGRRPQEDAGDRLRVSNGMAWGRDKERCRQALRW